MRRFVILSLIIILNFCAQAQKNHSMLDTVLLKEVVSYGELRKYQSGAKIETLSKEQLIKAFEVITDEIIKRINA